MTDKKGVKERSRTEVVSYGGPFGNLHHTGLLAGCFTVWGPGPHPQGLPAPPHVSTPNNLPVSTPQAPGAVKRELKPAVWVCPHLPLLTSILSNCLFFFFSLFCLGFKKIRNKGFLCPQSDTLGGGREGMGHDKERGCSRDTEWILPNYTF